MPEGPECRVTADYLNKLLHGKRLTEITLLAYKKPPLTVDAAMLSDYIKEGPVIVESVRSHGKLIYFKLVADDGDCYYIVCHYGLDGSWSLDEKKTSNVKLVVGDQSLYFNDATFGEFNILTAAEMEKRLAGSGVDVLSSDFTYDKFKEAIGTESKKAICLALMDQDKLAGIGNYLRAEILYRAAIDPMTRICDLTAVQRRRIYQAIVHEAGAAYQAGGSVGYSIGISGVGTYEPAVYARKKTPKGEKIVDKMVNGRRLYYVPSVYSLNR